MVFALVLAMPNYGQQFIVETDASGKCIGVVLMQKGHLIAFISKSLAPRHQASHEGRVENKADDALSRKPDAELLAMSLLSPHNSLLDQIKASWSSDQSLQGIIAKVTTLPYKYFIWHNNQLKWKGRLVVSADSELKRSIIAL
ncbi:hypothetical protein KY285_026990 [Solanum tuberosum]|nr:hypothetical protein KY285_026990 [Solanum tuberosum]